MDGSELRAELERLHRESFGWALCCCRRDPEAAESVLQTVYVKILQEKAVFSGGASFKTWLFSVIRLTAADERRRRWLRALRLAPLAESTPPADPQATPEEAASRSEELQRLVAALRRLPHRQREALHLVFYEDLSVAEAAGAMGISVGSARTHYERGKRRLRVLLDGWKNP